MTSGNKGDFSVAGSRQSGLNHELPDQSSNLSEQSAPAAMPSDLYSGLAGPATAMPSSPYSPPAGLGVTPPGDRFVCPKGCGFEWFRGFVSDSIPECPSDHVKLVPAAASARLTP
jgi:hypothetical protein